MSKSQVDNHFHTNLSLFDVLPITIFLSPLSPQVKCCATITYNHGIYELPYKLRLDLRKLGNITKVYKLHIMPSFPDKILLILAKSS